MKKKAALSVGCTLILAVVLLDSGHQSRADGLPPADNATLVHSPSDLGGIGLLQVPTARMGEDGDIRVGASAIEPYHRLTVSSTIFPWFEGVFRITDITNRLYGPVYFSGNQAYKDRGFDARLRLYKEDEYLPDITLGIRDLVGFGLFDSEYVAATRRYYDFDFTLGMGWGQLASSHQFENPFLIFGNHFRNRVLTTGGASAAGGARTDFFAGPYAALFGGVEWKTPIDNLTFKLEYNSDDYSSTALGEAAVIGHVIPIDFGLVYRPSPWFEFTLAEERNGFMFQFGFLTNVSQLSGAEHEELALPKPLTQRQAPIPAIATDEKATNEGEALPVAAWSDINSLSDIASRLKYRILGISNKPGLREVKIIALNTTEVESDRESIGQIARAVARIAPAVDEVKVLVDHNGTEQSYHFDIRLLERSVALTGRADQINFSPLPPQSPKNTKSLRNIDEEIAKKIFDDMDKLDFGGQTFEINGNECIVRFTQGRYLVPSIALGKVARIVDRYAPSEVKFITLALLNDGVEVMRARMLRRDLQAMFFDQASPEEVWAHTEFSGGGVAGPNAIENEGAFPNVSYRLRPVMKTQTNGPNGFFLYDLQAGLGFDANILPWWSITTESAAALSSNFGRLKLASNSLLPHVRSDIADYLRDGKYGIDRLQSDMITRLGEDFYGRLSFGILEQMYDGVDGELLYRPYGQRWAIDFDINQLYKRGFHERFGLEPYNVATGGVEFTYQLPWSGLTTSVRVGRYLARDVGATFEISREFESGVRIGGFATFTNVPASVFGEGEFDKGLFISIPIDLFLPVATRSHVGFLYRPDTRDGGQTLDISKPLYAETGGYDIDHLGSHWHGLQSQ